MRLLYQLFKNLPIQRKISFGILLTCGTALAVAAAAIFLAQLRTFRQSFTRDLESTGQMLAHTTTAAITFKDRNGAEDLLAAVQAKPYILRAAIDLPDGTEFASYQSSALKTAQNIARVDGLHSSGGYLTLNQPVMLAGDRIATLRLLCDYQIEYRRSLRLYLGILMLVLLVSVLLALALSNRLQRLIAAPILNLAATAQSVAEKKDYSLRAPKLSQDEVGRLTDAFNEMLAKIEQDDNALHEMNHSLAHEIEERKRREEEIEKLHKDLMLTSRQAGMAEVATGVLHNVGNVLNSVNVSANLMSDRLNQSVTGRWNQLASLLEKRGADLADFLTNDPKGRNVPQYVSALAAALSEERDQFKREVQALLTNVEHIKEIVSMQQNYATLAGVTEDLPVAELVDNALRMNKAAFQRHGIGIRQQFDAVPLVRVDKHKVLQILINLLRNAKYAMEDSGGDTKWLTLGVCLNGDRVKISVADNGIGIAPENLTRIFGHGFTTRRNGHGFGLHSGALAAREMGGSLHAWSEGLGKGATFVLELPTAPHDNTTDPPPDHRILDPGPVNPR
jgi:two-component system, NtrC family, sensor kinase